MKDRMDFWLKLCSLASYVEENRTNEEDARELMVEIRDRLNELLGENNQHHAEIKAQEDCEED